MEKNVTPYYEEILSYLSVHLDQQTEEVVRCVQQLFLCVFRPQDSSMSASSSRLSSLSTMNFDEKNSTEQITIMRQDERNVLQQRSQTQNTLSISQFLNNLVFVSQKNETPSLTKSTNDNQINTTIPDDDTIKVMT